MSHFTVLVTGLNVEEQLQPYHEFECTGEDDQYVQDIDVTEEYLKEYEEQKINPEYAILTFPEFMNEWVGYELTTSDRPLKYGYVLQNEDGSYKVIQRTNPNSKWDWYQIGGRWSGFFKLKTDGSGALGDRSLLLQNEPPVKSGRADVAYKGDIDFEGMDEEERIKANERYDKFEQLISDLSPEERKFKTWNEVFSDNPNLDIEDKRNLYHDQPVVKLLSSQRDYWWNTDDYAQTREEYVEGCVVSSYTTFAILHNGEWITRGRMGWFGIVTDEVDDERTFRQKQRALIQSLPDDTLLTVVDCHI